jgi:hypothetical protein
MINKLLTILLLAMILLGCGNNIENSPNSKISSKPTGENLSASPEAGDASVTDTGVERDSNPVEDNGLEPAIIDTSEPYVILLVRFRRERQTYLLYNMNGSFIAEIDLGNHFIYGPVPLSGDFILFGNFNGLSREGALVATVEGITGELYPSLASRQYFPSIDDKGILYFQNMENRREFFISAPPYEEITHYELPIGEYPFHTISNVMIALSGSRIATKLRSVSEDPVLIVVDPQKDEIIFTQGIDDLENLHSLQGEYIFTRSYTSTNQYNIVSINEISEYPPGYSIYYLPNSELSVVQTGWDDHEPLFIGNIDEILKGRELQLPSSSPNSKAFYGLLTTEIAQDLLDGEFVPVNILNY